MKIEKVSQKTLIECAKILNQGYFDSEDEAALHLHKHPETAYCAISGNAVCGVMIYLRDYSHYSNYLSDIVVLREYRRQGIASALLEKYFEISGSEQPKKQPLVLSSTDSANIASIMLHNKCGFTEIGRLGGLHYGKDEIFFARKIQ